jgi:hypothetical protein
MQKPGADFVAYVPRRRAPPGRVERGNWTTRCGRGPACGQDPEDQLAVTIWNADGIIAHASPTDIDIPREGLVTLMKERDGPGAVEISSSRDRLAPRAHRRGPENAMR